MLITKEQLYSYINCPLKYNFEYNMKMASSIKSEDEIYKRCLLLCIKSFYYSLLDGKFITPHELKIKWGSVWSNETIGMDISKDYNKKALNTLIEFHNWAKDNCGIPIDIDREYMINIGDNKLYGKVNIIRQKFDKTIDIINFKTWENIPESFTIDTDMELTIDTIAFNAIYESTPDSESIYILKIGKEIMTRRVDDDIKRFTIIFNSVCKSIENEIYFPRWNYSCKKCEHQNRCRLWKG